MLIKYSLIFLYYEQTKVKSGGMKNYINRMIVYYVWSNHISWAVENIFLNKPGNNNVTTRISFLL